MVNGADAVARLDNWFWTPVNPSRDALIGEIFDDPPPRSWPDGADCKTSNVSELEQQGAVEGKIIVTMTGRRYLLGKAATHASLAAERDDAQREADALREQLEAPDGPTRPRCCWPHAEQAPARARARRLLLGRAEGRLVRRERQAVRARRPSEPATAPSSEAHGCAGGEACTIPWEADLLLHHEKERREPRQAVLREREAHLAHIREANAEAKAEGLLWESLAVEERQRRCKAVR